MSLRAFSSPWRKIYEVPSVIGWIVACLTSGYWVKRTSSLSLLFLVVLIACTGFALVRGAQMFRILRLKIALTANNFETMTLADLFATHYDPKTLFLGWGYEWTVPHSQRLYDLLKVDVRSLSPPEWVRQLFPGQLKTDEEFAIGAAWLHAIGTDEKPIRVPVSMLEGHTLYVGVTGAGKSTVLKTEIVQDILRGNIVIVVDGKGGQDIEAAMRKACVLANRPDSFIKFHPSFPTESVRFDGLFNWHKVTEVPSRVTELIASEDETFKNFGWWALNVVATGLVDTASRPNLLKLKKYIEGNPEALLEQALVTHFNRVMPSSWRQGLEKYKKSAHKSAQRHSTNASEQLLAMIAYYEDEVSERFVSQAVVGLITVFRHNREHYQKITANLLPILSMLTSGELGAMLSPDPDDIDDTRVIMDTAKVIRGEHCFYVALDSLADKVSGSAIGSLFIADLCSQASARYNFGKNGPPISVFIDELAIVGNEPLIEILARGRGAGIRVVATTQTMADLSKRLGSEDAARVMLGNFNSLIALRAKDLPTQKYVVEEIGKGYIQSLSSGISTAGNSETGLAHYRGTLSQSVSETLEEKIPPDMIGRLPNFEYFASVAGGHVYKGRFPLLID